MELKLSNPELVELDKSIFSLNKKYAMALNSLGKIPNLYASSEVIKEIDFLIRSLKGSKPEGEFDELYVENSLHNLETQKAYLDYFTTAKEANIDKLMEIAFGEKALDIVKENCKNFDYKSYWNLFLSHQEYGYKQIPSDAEEFRETLKNILADLKQDVLEYAEEHFNLPKSYDFDLILGAPYSNRTYFHPTTRRMEISPQDFFIFKEGEEIKINVSFVISSLFHEVVGHGRQEYNSRNLPLALQDNSVNTSLITSHTHAEGVAQITRDFSINFMKKYKDKYKIDEDFINQSVLSSATETAGSFRVLSQYLKLKSFEDSKLDIESIFKKITNNHGLFMLYSSMGENPISCLHNSTYIVGLAYMNELLDELKKEYGDNFDKRLPEINKAISVGMWNFRVLPKFVKFVLNN